MPRRSTEPRYRRRVVLELTPEESELLDRLAERHGTIRGAVLVGLRELEADRSADLEAQVRDLTEQLVTAERSAEAERDRLAAELEAATEQMVASRDDLKAAQAERKAARLNLRETKAKLSAQSSAHRAAKTQLRAAESRLVHHAYCGACEKFVPESEWAEQPDGQQGVYVYHQPDGFRPKRGRLGPATLLVWRGHASEGSSR